LNEFSHHCPALNSEQLDHIVSKVRERLLNRLDAEVCYALNDLDLEVDISDEDWQAIIDQLFC
jgi:hypothetical protein